MNIKELNQKLSETLDEDLDMKVWIDEGDTLMFETKIRDYADYEHNYFPHLLNCTVEIWDGDDLLHNIKIGYGA